MIAICGDLASSGRRESLAVSIAERAIAARATVQVVGIVPTGSDGDATLLKLAATGIGHAAVLRTAARPLENADLELALRYLPDIGVVIAVELDSIVLATVSDGAAFTGASLIVVQPHGATEAAAADADLPASAIVIGAPGADPDATFAGFVADFAARLDAGAVPADAWNSSVRALAVDAVSRAPDRRGPAAAR